MAGARCDHLAETDGDLGLLHLARRQVCQGGGMARRVAVGTVAAVDVGAVLLDVGDVAGGGGG